MGQRELKKCVYCGETFKFSFNEVKCPFCGNVNHVVEDGFEEKLLQAKTSLNTYDFSDADELYFNLANSTDDPSKKALALWGRLLATFGVVYIRSFKDNKYIPTFANVNKEVKSLKESLFFKAIMELDLKPKEKQEYIDLCEELNSQYVKIHEDLSRVKEYDVFICVKISLSTATRKNVEGFTLDSKIANDVYNELVKKNLKVFYSEKCLKGVEYDAQILSALVRSKRLIIISSSREYLDSPWVQSEWRRWLNFIKLGEKKENTITLYTIEKLSLPYALNNKNVKVVSSQLELLENFKEKSEHNAEQVDEAIELVSKMKQDMIFLSYVEKINQEIKLLPNEERNNILNIKELRKINQAYSKAKDLLEIEKAVDELNNYNIKDKEWADKVFSLKKNISRIKSEDSISKVKLHELLSQAKKVRRKNFLMKIIRKMPLLLSGSLIIFAGIFALSLTIFQPMNKYEKGSKYLESNEYENAVKYLSNNNYKDSKELLTFANACVNLKNNEIVLAVERIESIKGKIHITYNPNGGQIENLTQDISSLEENFYTPLHDDDFIGWSVEEVKVFSVDNYEVSIKMIANYKLKEYKITYVLNGANPISNPISFTREDEFEITNPTRIGYEFSGWIVDGNKEEKVENVKIEKNTNRDIILEATWTLKKYTITYNLDGGSNNEENPIEYYVDKKKEETSYESKIILKSPTKNGYYFLGWFQDQKKIEVINKNLAKDLTLTAKWKPITYNCILHIDSEIDIDGPLHFSFSIEDEKTIPLASKKGYSFIGWYDSKSNKVLESTTTKDFFSDLDLYPLFTPNKYKVTLVVCLDGVLDSNLTQEIDVYYDDLVKLPNLVIDGYYFNNWYLDEEMTIALSSNTFTYKYEEDLVLYGNFIKESE